VRQNLWLVQKNQPVTRLIAESPSATHVRPWLKNYHINEIGHFHLQNTILQTQIIHIKIYDSTTRSLILLYGIFVVRE
jgi:hypothetical protein